MFVVRVLYFVQLFSWLNSFINPSICSFPLAFLSYLLSSILLDVSRCLISQNIGCLVKSLFKNSTQTIFQGGSPWAALIFNSMLWGSSIVSSFFFYVNMFKHFCILSFPSVFLSYFLSSILPEINWKSIESKLNINWKSIERKLKSIENQLKVLWNQLNINWNQLKINWNQLKINWKYFEINWKSIEINWTSIDSTLFRPRPFKSD